jgi:hypothetical protein
MESQATTIQVSIGTYDRLRQHKKVGVSFEQIVSALLDEVEGKELKIK